jgi:hypothetical protein
MKQAISGALLCCVLTVSAAHANRAADICAASLQPPARLVFNAVSNTPQSQDTLRKVLEARVRELVFMDRLTVSGARPAAEAASQCLRIVRNCTGETC